MLEHTLESLGSGVKEEKEGQAGEKACLYPQALYVKPCPLSGLEYDLFLSFFFSCLFVSFCMHAHMLQHTD